jgi:hypothetical protein
MGLGLSKSEEDVMHYSENRLSAVWNGAVLYKMERGRWPKDDSELLLFAALKGIDLDVDGFEYLDWEEGGAGELVIRFILKPRADEEVSGSVRVHVLGEGLALDSIPVTVRIHYTPENPRRYCPWPACTLGVQEPAVPLLRAS